MASQLRAIRVILLLAVCLPQNAHALGFGKPAVESALGEPLRIVLPIVAFESGELDELVARLAAQNWFQLSGLDYGEINDQLNVVVDTTLQAVVISTLQPVSQVVVPLVIELEGPRKVMRKQFTVLINPASYEEAVTASTNTGVPATGLNLAEGVTGNATTTALPASEQEANQEISTTSLSTPQVSTNPQNTVAGSVTRPDRVVVAKGDSLSTIVDRFLPDGANRYQGRMAFYNDNPSAFYQGNIHNLTRGAELIVPPAEDILALPAAEARRTYQTLASKPVPGQESVTADGSDVEERSLSGGAEVVDDSAGTQSQATADEPQQAGFRLSVLEVADASEDAAEQGKTPAAGNSAATAEGGGVQDGSDAQSSAVAGGQQFQMQGFTMKLSVMNAYIVELQEENQQLKDRVAALEEKVHALITRETAVAVPQDETATVFGSDSIEDDQVGLTDEPAIVGQNNEQDLASVLTNSGALFTQQELKEIAAEVAEPDTDIVAVDDGTEVDVTVVEQAEVAALTDQPASDTAAATVAGDPAIDSEVNTTVEQMLAELDAELNVVEEQYSSDAAEAEQPEDTVVPQSETGSASDRVVVGSSRTEPNAADSPKATFLQGLQDKAKTLLGDLNGPILQLIVAVILLAALLFAWMMRRGKNKPEVAAQEEPAAAAYEPPTGRNVGVTYAGADNELSLLLDDEDEQWMSQPDISMENLDTLQESDVDLITQSEVYLTYNRPMQAVQALTEEYSKNDSDKFVVGSRLIKVFEKIGSSDERNTAMRNFIVTLNNDIEEFTNSEWDALRFDLDALRRNEQAAAVDDHDKETSIDMNSFNPLAEPESLQDGRGAPQLDESVIDLDFHTSDKSG